MKRDYIRPAICGYTVSMTNSMLNSSLPLSKGRKTDESFSRRLNDRWDEEVDTRNLDW